MPMRKSSLKSSSRRCQSSRSAGRRRPGRAEDGKHSDPYADGGAAICSDTDDDDDEECHLVRDAADNDDGDEGVLQVRRKRSKTNKSGTTMKRTKTPKKSVDFHRRVRIRKIPMIDEMPESMLQELFYSRSELLQVRTALREKIQHYTDHTDIVEDEEDEYDDGGVFCLRGLEGELPEARMRRRLLKAIARKTVIVEQQTQRTEGYHDPMALSLMYQKESFPAVEAAVLIAAKDEFEARMIQNED
jgi:hypothetical protein